MFELFNRKKSEKVLVAFATGRVVPIEEVPDPVFSEKTLGGGVAIKPVSNMITSPCDGIVTTIMEESKHAVGIRSLDGIEILIHEGLETVMMKGNGFKLFVNEGESVKAGDKLIGFDPEKIQESGCDTICVMAVTNEDEFPNLVYESGMDAVGGTTVIGRYK